MSERTSCVGGLRCLAPGAIDEAGTRQLTPEVDAVRFTGASIEFAWSSLNNVGNYTLSIATDEAMTQFVADTPKQTGARSEESVELNEGVYWWRATADVSVKEDVAPRRLLVFGDSVYVFCAVGDSCEATDTELGTVDSPFKSLVRGLGAAARIGVPNVRVASRDSATPYEETLVLSGGINVFGGYSRDFALREARTLLRSNDTHVRAFANTMPFVFDGFEIVRDTGAKPLIDVGSNDARVTISNCVLSATTGSPVLVNVAEGTDEVVIADSEVRYSFTGGQSAVISTEDAHLRIERTQLTVTADAIEDGLIAVSARGGTLDIVDTRAAISAPGLNATLQGVVAT